MHPESQVLSSKAACTCLGLPGMSRLCAGLALALLLLRMHCAYCAGLGLTLLLLRMHCAGCAGLDLTLLLLRLHCAGCAGLSLALLLLRMQLLVQLRNVHKQLVDVLLVLF